MRGRVLLTNYNQHRGKRRPLGRVDRILQKGTPMKKRVLLPSPEPTGRTRSQNDGSHAHSAHCAGRYREAPPRAICCATTSAVMRRDVPSLPCTQA